MRQKDDGHRSYVSPMAPSGNDNFSICEEVDRVHLAVQYSKEGVSHSSEGEIAYRRSHPHVYPNVACLNPSSKLSRITTVVCKDASSISELSVFVNPINRLVQVCNLNDACNGTKDLFFCNGQIGI